MILPWILQTNGSSFQRRELIYRNRIYRNSKMNPIPTQPSDATVLYVYHTSSYLCHDSGPSGESCISVTACENPLARGLQDVPIKGQVTRKS